MKINHVSMFMFAVVIACCQVGFAAKAKKSPSQPFNGKDLKGWTTKQPASRTHWKVGTAKLDEKKPNTIAFSKGGNQLVNTAGHGVDTYTLAKYGSVKIELEVMVPKGSNSGIYVMGEYEIQVYDSYGKKKLGGGDMGAIYGASPPRVNACLAPGKWQKYEILFKAPKFDKSGKKIANAKFVKVTLNGKVLHENVEVKGSTPSAVTGKEAATGPLMFQGDHGPIAYRNIKITPLK